MNWTKTLLCTTLLLGPFGSIPARAQPVTPVAQVDSTLTPSQALSRVWRGNITLRQLRREYAQAQARRLQAGLLPNPEVGWTAEDFAGSAAFTDDRFTQFTLEWVQTLPLGDRLARARRLAELEAELLGWEYRVQQLRLAGDVYLAHGRLRYLATRLELAQELHGNARETLTLIETRVGAGKQPPVAALQARQQVLALEAETLNLASQQRIAALELSALWGGSSLEGLTVTGGFSPARPMLDVQMYQQALAQHPQVARWQLEDETRKAALASAQADATPDLATSGGLRYHPPGDWGVVASVTLPLPVYNLNQGSIEAAHLRQSSLAAEREQDLAQLSSELHLAQERYQGASQRLEIYRNQLQLAQEEFRIAVLLFNVGKTGYLEVLQSQKSYFETRQSMIETQWELEQALMTLRTLIHDLDPIEDVPITTSDQP